VPAAEPLFLCQARLRRTWSGRPRAAAADGEVTAGGFLQFPDLIWVERVLQSFSLIKDRKL